MSQATENTNLWRQIARDRTNELSAAHRRAAELRISRNGWRIRWWLTTIISGRCFSR